MKVLFDEVGQIFDSYSVWCGGRELLWYQYAWGILEKAGLTEYHNAEQRTLVYIRIFTLIMIYGEYCELNCGEYFAYEFIDWQEVSGINPFRLGQVAVMLLESDDNYFDEDDDYAMELAFNALVEKERINVINMLVKHVGHGAESELFVALYLSCHDMIDYEDDTDVDTEQLDSIHEYRNDIDRYFEEIVNDCTVENMQAVEWLIAGTERLRL